MTERQTEIGYWEGGVQTGPGIFADDTLAPSPAIAIKPIIYRCRRHPNGKYYPRGRPLKNRGDGYHLAKGVVYCITLPSGPLMTRG